MSHKTKHKQRIPHKGRAKTRSNGPVAEAPAVIKGVEGANPVSVGPVVVKSHNANFGIQLAESPSSVTLLHFSDGPFQIQILPNSRSYAEWWKVQPDLDAKSVALKWLHHPLGIALRGSDEALDAILALAHDKPWNTSRKVEKVEKQAVRAGQPSSVARAIIRAMDYMNPKSSKAIYEACEKAGVNRKLAASVLCNLRKKLK